MSALGKLVVSLALEYAHYSKGLDKSSQESLKFAQNVQRHMDMATESAGEFFSGVVQGSVQAAAAYIGVAATVDRMRQSIDRMDKFDDLSQKLSLSAKSLQEYNFAGKMTGVSLDDLASGVKKLQVNMTEAATGNKEQQKLFAALGITVKDTNGVMRASEDVIGDVADVFSSLENGSVKTALAIKLFGKNGAEMIPYLNQGKSGIKDMADEAERLGGIMGDDALKAAADFNDQMDKLGTLSEAAANRMTAALLPAVNDLIERFLQGKKAGMGFWESVLNAGGITVNRALGESYGKQIRDINREIEMLRGSKNSLSIFGTSGIDEDIEKLEKVRSVLQQMQALRALEGNQVENQDRFDRLLNPANALNVAAILAALDEEAAKRAEEAAKSAQKKYDELIKRSQDYMVQLKKEADTAGMTAEEKKTFDAQWIAGELSKGGVNSKYVLDFLNFAQKQIDATAAIVKAQKEVEESNKRAGEARKEVDRLFKSYNESINKSVEAAIKEAESNEKLAATLGMTKAQVESLELAELELQYAQRSTIGMTLDQVEALEKLILAKRRSVTALTEIESFEQQKRLWESVDQTAHDTFVSIFDSGKSAFDRLRDTLKNGLLDLLYQMTIKKWIFSIGATVSGMPGLAQAAGSHGSTLGDASSIYSAGTTLWDGFNTGFASMGAKFGTTVMNAGDMFGSSTMVDFGRGMTGTTGGSTAMTMGNYASAAASYAGNAAVGHFANKLISDGYQINKTLDKLATVASAFNPLIGVAAGVANRLFGRRPKEYTTAGIQGNFNQEGFTDAKNFQRWEQKGGVFRSDKDGTDYTALDALYVKSLGDGFKALKSTTSDFAQSLGLNAGLIAGYAKGMVIDLTGDQVKDAEILAKAFGDMGDEMATILLPNFKEFQKTGESASATLGRLASVNQMVDGVFGAIGIDAVAAFNGVGVAAANAKQRLVDVTGGMDAFLAKSNFFVSNFLSEAEQLKPASDRIAAVFARHNIAGDISKDDFAARVKKALLDTSDAGKAMANELLDIAPLFLQVANFAEKSATVLDKAVDTVVDAVDDGTDTAAIAAERIRVALDGVATAYDALQRSVEAQRESVTKAYEAAIAPITKSIDKLKGLSQSLHSALDGRRIEAHYGVDRAAAQAQIATALAIARAGGVFPDADALSRSLSLVSEPSEQLFATFEDYQRDFLKTSINIRELASLTDDQLSVDEKRLAAEEENYKAEMSRLDSILTAAQAEVDAINGVNTSVLSVAAAIAGLNGAIAGAKAAGAGGGSSTNSAVASLYDRFSDRSYMSAEGAAYWAARVNSGESTASIEKSFQDSVKAVRGFEVGTNYVPSTGLALIHEGERIVPAADNRKLMERLQSPTDNSVVLAAELKETKAKLVKMQTALEQIVLNTSRGAKAGEKSADIQERTTKGGNEVRVKVIG